MTDAQAATELKLYIDNDGSLYRGLTTSILKNLATKRARGEYRHDLAVKAFGYLTEAGAKKYARKFGSSDQPWHKMFPAGTRKQAAEVLTRDFEAEAALGNYDHLLPKKYQGQKSGGAHARRKVLSGRGATAHTRKKSVSARGPARRQVRKTDQKSGFSTSSGIAAQDIREFRSFLGNASDSQVQGIYEKEKRAGRDEYAELAVVEAASRGLSLDGHYNHARRKSPAQFAHEIVTALGTRRYHS
jgi:hypothetical protein